MESERLTIKKKPALVVLGLVLGGGLLLQIYFKLSAGNTSLESIDNTAKSIDATLKTEKISALAPESDWQTYTNEKLGFSIKFPTDATLRGTPESDFAIVTLDRSKTNNKQALITFSKKTPPLGKTYSTIEEFWKDEKINIEKNGGIVSGAAYVELNGVKFWQAQEKNSTINFIGLHRYIQSGATLYEGVLTIEGEALLPVARELYDRILATLSMQAAGIDNK